MKKTWIAASLVGFAAAEAPAQTIPASISNSLFQVAEDDGGAELAYKLLAPTPAGEAYNVDFDADGAGLTVMGVAVAMYSSTGGTPQIGQIAICGDNLALDASGRTPDLANPLSSLPNATSSAPFGAFCSGFTTYDTPDVTLGTGGAHAVVSFATGDSNTYLCTDAWDSLGFNHTGARHSYFTTDSYATPAAYSANKWNYMIRLAAPPPTPGGGLFLVNGTTSGTMYSSRTVGLQFWSSDGNAATQYLEFLAVTSSGPYLPLPGVVLTTGTTNFLPNGVQQLGVMTGPMPCVAIGSTLQFGCFFSDNLDQKPNGRNKIKISNLASVAVLPDKTCRPNVCFGIADDGTMDNYIFNPRVWYGLGTAAGTNDAASVHMGRVSPLGPAVKNLTAVESVTWDFCGGFSWQLIAICKSNTVLDPSGNTPDIASPLTSICNSSAYHSHIEGTWGFPAEVYDVPDVVANTTTDYHSVYEWSNGDSCLFLGLDTNGTGDDDGSDCVPALSGTSPAGSASFFSLDGFATPAVDSTNGGTFPVFNVMERIDWN